MIELNRRKFIQQMGGLSILSLSSPWWLSSCQSLDDMSYDLIIIGAGTAGLTCSIKAAQQGANVLLLEKAEKVGGTLWVSHGQMSAAGTRLQKEAGIEDNPQKHFQEVMRLSSDTADPVLVKRAVEQAPRLIAWLDELSFPFHSDSPGHVPAHELYDIPRTHWGLEGGKSILKCLQPLLDEAIESGGIRLELNCSLDHLVEEKGKLVGVVASLKGSSQLFKGKNIVLTTGGYASNPDFFEKMTPGAPRLISSSMPSSQGEGAKAAMAIGAQFRWGEKHSHTLGGIELKPGSGRADAWDAWARLTSSVSRKPREIYVGADGKRFMNEDSPSPEEREKASLEIPDRKFWLIFDDEALQEDCVVVQWSPEELRKQAQKGRAVWMADDLKSLATKCGIDPEGLLKTVKGFNSYVDQGKDLDFGRGFLEHPIRKKPYYALLTYGFSLLSFGGLMVNGDLEVQDQEGQVIPNLYAAGEVLGGAATSGQAFVGGMLLTPALSFGMWLGEKLGAPS